MSGKPILGILLGDAAGVGPEIIVKLAASRFYDEYCRPIVIGDVRVFERGARICGLEIPVQVIDKVEEADWTKGMPVLDQRDVDPEQVPFANISIESGRACLNMLKTAIELYQAGRIDGFCFAPLNKQAMIQAGCPFESEPITWPISLDTRSRLGKSMCWEICGPQGQPAIFPLARSATA